MSCGADCRRGSEPELLWLWRRLAATSPIRPLAWEPPYAARAALRGKKKHTHTHTHTILQDTNECVCVQRETLISLPSVQAFFPFPHQTKTSQEERDSKSPKSTQ